MGIILGLTAALCWGMADFLARYATRLVGSYRTLLFMQGIGLLILSYYVVASGELQRSLGSGWQPWAWLVVANLLEIASALALYRAFEVGVISVVSPVAASYAAVTVVLSFASGERLEPLRWAGIAAALVGVVLASAGPAAAARVKAQVRGHSFFHSGIALALFAAVAFGVTFWMYGFLIIPYVGGVIPVWLVRVMTPTILLLVARPSGQSVRLPRGSIWWLIIGVGLLDTVAFVANSVGLGTDQVSVVSVIGSLFSAVTVLLAAVFLHDRLRWSQWLGVAITLVGVALVSAR